MFIFVVFYENKQVPGTCQKCDKRKLKISRIFTDIISINIQQQKEHKQKEKNSQLTNIYEA
jgi:hypothetical protein